MFIQLLVCSRDCFHSSKKTQHSLSSLPGEEKKVDLPNSLPTQLTYFVSGHNHFASRKQTFIMCNVQCAIQKMYTCWVLQTFEETGRILKKFVHACIVNVIHANVLPGFVL